MNIYIDESGSINNHDPHREYFVISMVRALDTGGLKKSYKRFVSSHLGKLRELDKGKVDPKTGNIIKSGGKMFCGEKFKELKGAQFDRNMKLSFIDFFSQKQNFELYYIVIANPKLSNAFCQNTARVFNYSLKIALDYFLKNGYLPDCNYTLQLDERNEKTETRYFLKNYLNTELKMSGSYTGNFDVMYFDSSNNVLIQIADVFANLYFSNLQTGAYSDQFDRLKELGLLKFIFCFPK